MEKPAFSSTFNKKKKWYDKLLNAVIVIAFAVMLAYIVFVVIFAKIEVIGPSMQPAYNAGLPLAPDGLTSSEQKEYYTNHKIKDIVYVNRFNKGSRGDVVVLEKSDDYSIIKRVIAIAGDEINIKDDGTGKYFVYLKRKGQTDFEKLQEAYIKDREEMNKEYYYFRRYKSILFELNEFNPLLTDMAVEIPVGKLFLMGDNRGHSGDSSSEGPYEIKNIVGTVAFCVRYNQNIFQFFWHSIFG